MEKTFFQDAGATVTNARFITDGQTHAMSGITSVQEVTDEPMRGAPILLAAVGLVACAASAIMGVALMMGAAFWWYGQKTTYTVAIRTSAGELKALTDTDGVRVQRIVEALNQAIVYRN
ncbi:QacE [Deinococcus sp. D7000]|nr:QacE [Deinococcus sp. D7000]